MARQLGWRRGSQKAARRRGTGECHQGWQQLQSLVVVVVLLLLLVPLKMMMMGWAKKIEGREDLQWGSERQGGHVGVVGGALAALPQVLGRW